MLNFLHSKLKDFKGFTLLEMIISIGIFVLVATASSAVFNQALRAYRYTTSRMAAVREAELAMEWIVRDIRPDAADNVLPISTGADAGFLNSDDDELTLGNVAVANRIHYYLSPDPVDPTLFTIQRLRPDAVGSPQDLLAQNVVSLSFSYFDAQNQNILDSAGDPDTAKTVEIIIETSVNGQKFRLYNVANR